jgi:hypothetical protein
MVFFFPNIFAKVNFFLLKNKIHTGKNQNQKIPQVLLKNKKIKKST